MWSFFLRRFFGKKSRVPQQFGLQPDLALLFYSHYLSRTVQVDLYYPPGHFHEDRQTPYRLLVFNDGQDLPRASFATTFRELQRKSAVPPILALGIHPGDRVEEYGTAGQPDYQQRGKLAAAYQRCLLEEILPVVDNFFPISTNPAQRGIAGFSLGGLSAFDIAWNHPDYFGRVGVFSGALWWRSQPFKPEDPDADRIVHTTIEQSGKQPGLKFWFQAGTRDERSDRNNNGVIDAIDDTLDAMRALIKAGYRAADLKYEEVKGGTHDPETWGRVMPAFLRWFAASDS